MSAKPNDQNLERLLYEFDENFKKLSICADDEFIDKYTELAEAIVRYDSTNCLEFLLKYFNDNDEGYNGL